MACPEGYVPCDRNCGGCVPDSKVRHDDCDPPRENRSEDDSIPEEDQ